MFHQLISPRLLPLLAVAPLVLGPVPRAAAETTQCTAITRVPTVIARPGHYCLKKDLRFAPRTGNAIDIRVGNVLLDMNGYFLRGDTADENQAVGIAVRNKPNVRIANGTLVHFGIGLSAVAASGLLVESMNVLQSKNTGISFDRTRGSIIRDSRFLNNFDFARGPELEEDLVFFPRKQVIKLRNTDGTRVINNDITNTGKYSGDEFPRSIHAIWTEGPVAGAIAVENNRIMNTEGIAIAIQGSSTTTIIRNTVNKSGDWGLIVSADGSALFRGNTFLNARQLSGGGEIDAGGNVSN